MSRFKRVEVVPPTRCLRVLGVAGTDNVQCPECSHRWDPRQVPEGARALLCPDCGGNTYAREVPEPGANESTGAAVEVAPVTDPAT